MIQFYFNSSLAKYPSKQLSKQILKLVSGNDDKHVVVKWNVKPSEEKRLHGKAQIDVPPNDYNSKKP